MGVSLILLPGIDGSGTSLQGLVDNLPSWVKPVVVPYPSDRILSYEQLLELVMESLPKSRAFMLLGESFGGPLAVMAAALGPAGLVGLILCASFVTPPRKFVGPLMPWIARPTLIRFFMPLKRLRAWLCGYGTPEILARLVDFERRLDPAVIAARLRMVFGVDLREELRSLAVPVMYIRATRDVVVPGRCMREIERTCPKVRIVKFASSHLVLQNRGRETAAAVAEFAETCLAAVGRTEQNASPNICVI